MPPSRRTLFVAIALVAAVGLGANGPCGGGDSGGEGPGPGASTSSGGTSSGGTSSGASNGQPNPPAPAVSIAPTSLSLVVPGACERSFTVANTGPGESRLEYHVRDDGALGGFLDVMFADGTLSGGNKTTVSTKIKPVFATPDLKATALVLNVYTPGASNFTKVPVAIKVLQRAELAAGLVGTWAGTWSGISYGRPPTGQAQPTTPVSGSFSIAIAAVDVAAGTASGTIAWTGTDASWRYTVDGNGIATATPAPFVPDRTIAFSASNTKIGDSAGTQGCAATRFRFVVDNKDLPNPSDAFYGPSVDVELDAETGDLRSYGVGFTAHPYDPSNFDTGLSTGSMTGKKTL